MTEHAKGWIDATMRLRPPVFATEDYIAGFREGFVSRLAAVKDALILLQEKGQ